MKYSAVTVAVFPVICNYSSEEDIETSSKNDKIESYHEKGAVKDANYEWRILYATIENADPVLVKLNEQL